MTADFARNPLNGRRKFAGVLLDVLGRGVMRPRSSTTDIYINACAAFNVPTNDKSAVRKRIAQVHFQRYPVPGPRFVADGTTTLLHAAMNCTFSAGKEYWQYMVAHATGSADQRIFNHVYEHYSNADNWMVHIPE